MGVAGGQKEEERWYPRIEGKRWETLSPRRLPKIPVKSLGLVSAMPRGQRCQSWFRTIFIYWFPGTLLYSENRVVNIQIKILSLMQLTLETRDRHTQVKATLSVMIKPPEKQSRMRIYKRLMRVRRWWGNKLWPWGKNSWQEPAKATALEQGESLGCTVDRQKPVWLVQDGKKETLTSWAEDWQILTFILKICPGFWVVKR